MLYSPIIDTKLPAFQYPTSGNIILSIPYKMNRSVGLADFNGFQLLVKTVSTGKEIVNISSNSYSDNSVEFVIEDVDKFQPNQFYKIQLAYRKNEEIGYYSSAGVIKCTDTVIVEILGLQKQNIINSFLYTYEGVYKNNDSSEKVYNYYFNIYDESDNLHDTSGLLIHNNNNKDEDITISKDSWSPTKSLVPGKNYQVEYGVKTINGLEVVSSRYTIADNFAIAPPSECTTRLSAKLYRDDGYIELSLINGPLTGKFILSRASSKDNFQNWDIITKVLVINHPEGLVIWKDFTIEQGVEYLYSIRLYNDNGIFSTHIVNDEHKIQADFEDMFLYDGDRQLKIKFNPKVGSFKTTRLETKTDTIGGTYPYFFRNGNIAYKEFPISGLISLLGDENELFIKGLRPADLTRPRTNSPETNPKAANTQLTADNFINEREFKLAVLEWLGDGKPKLFRSPGEGNYIVRLMNTSLTPNDALSRMIHTFSCTAYELMDYNFKNLKAQKYLNVEEEQNYLNRHVSVKLNNQLLPNDGIILFKKNTTETIITSPDSITVNSNGTISLKPSSERVPLHNIVITNAIPLSEDFYRDSKTPPVADIEGKINMGASAKIITCKNANQLQLAHIDFDYENSFNTVDWWSEWNIIKAVKGDGQEKLNSIYNSKLYVLDNSGNVITDLVGYNGSGYMQSDNLINYLDYLNNYIKQQDNNDQLGEVCYLRICKRKIDFTKDELDRANFIISIKSYTSDLDYISLRDGSRVYRDLGILSELKCGNGYDIDIVFLKRQVS